MLQPLSNHVVIERVKPKDKTEGGILLPDTAQRKPTEGKVIAVGPGKVNDVGGLMDMSVAVGDLVLFTDWTGTEVEHEGKTYLVCSEGDILGKLVKE